MNVQLNLAKIVICSLIQQKYNVLRMAVMFRNKCLLLFVMVHKTELISHVKFAYIRHVE